MADAGKTTQQANDDDSAAHLGEKWGDRISEERQAELRTLFERQKAWVAQPEETRGDSAFEGVPLTGADVFWLAESERDEEGAVPNLHLERARLVEAQLQGANLVEAHLEQAVLTKANLQGADLTAAQLKRAILLSANLQGADLALAQLERAFLVRAQLERADLRQAQLEAAVLRGAHLERAILRWARLERATVRGAQLQRADLREAQLQGADLREVQLQGANLTGATFDKTSHLKEAVLTGTSLDRVTYDGVNLTNVDWTLVPMLGDELTARQRTGTDGRRKDRTQHLEEFRAAVRANRVLAIALRSQGMNEDADRYAYRAQLLHRTVLRLRRRWGAAFGSWLLDLISGYGYKPVRSVIAYITIILFFATLYLINGQFAAPHLRWDEALILSISSFHGRGFFTSGISLGDTLARLAAGEAIIGLLIEITFIATFTQRFFAR